MSGDKDSTLGKYNKSNYSNREERKQLFSEVLELDYMKGPTRVFKMDNKLWAMHNSPLVDMVLESAGSISSEKKLATVKSSYISYLDEFLVIAEFYSELKSKMPKKPATKKGMVFNSFESLKSYFKKNEDLLASYFNNDMQPCLVRLDKRNRKYIQLTEAGENAFKAIWDNVERSNSRKEIPFSKLDDIKDIGCGIEFNFESDKILEVEKNRRLDPERAVEENRELVNPEFITVGDDKTPSLLTQNALSSAGLNEEYSASDEFFVGDRSSIRREVHSFDNGISRLESPGKSRKIADHKN